MLYSYHTFVVTNYHKWYLNTNLLFYISSSYKYEIYSLKSKCSYDCVPSGRPRKEPVSVMFLSFLLFKTQTNTATMKNSVIP